MVLLHSAKEVHQYLRAGVFLLLLLIPLLSLAERYEGYVLDEAGHPVPFATVYLQDNPYIGTATGQNGHFQLEAFNSERSQVIISFIGYEKQVLPLTFFLQPNATVILKEQPIALQETVVSAKPSKQKNKRKQMAQLLYQVYNRMQYDFPSKPYKLKLVSDVKMDLESTPWGMEQMIASVIQIPEGRRDGRDSVQFMGEYCKRFFAQTIRDRADTILANENLDHRVRKMAVEMDSGVVVHNGLWQTGNICYDFQKDMEQLSAWTVTRENEGETVLTFREHKNYLGIFKYEILRHYIVNSQTYRVLRFVEEGSMDVNIPFGYKLKEGELEMLNLLNLSNAEIEQFRIKSGHAKVMLNTIYRMQDGHLYPLERNLRTDATLQSTRRQKQTIPIRVRATQRVTSVQTSGVQPLRTKPSRRVPREIVPVY